MFKLKATMRPLLVAALPLVFAACGLTGPQAKVFPLDPGQRTLAAQGEAKVKTTKNNNSQVEVKLKHLPEPSSLDPSLRTYVVWIDPGVGRPNMPLGQVHIDQDREGKLRAETPFKDFDIFVTAESTGTPEKPSQYVVLEGKVTTAP